MKHFSLHDHFINSHASLIIFFLGFKKKKKKKKQLEFQLDLWASNSHISLAQGHFLIILVNDFITHLISPLTVGQ